MEQTLAIIKPDAVRKKLVGAIIAEIEKGDFFIRQIDTLSMDLAQAADFYRVHEGKAFYDGLINFMSSGQIFVLLLEGAAAVEHWRQLMGDTDPNLAGRGTIRHRFGTTVRENAVHGSDSLASARREINFFFGEGK